MKKRLILLLVSISVILSTEFALAQEVVLSHKVHSVRFTNDGEVYEIIGEVTNNSGKNVCGVTINVNYFDAIGKKLGGPNLLENNQKGEYSDKQVPTTDYLANGATVPFRFMRFVDKISGKVDRSEVVFTGRTIKAPTCAIIEDVRTVRLDMGYGVFYHKVLGRLTCTAGKVFSGNVIIAGYDENGKLIQVSDYVLDNANVLEAGQSADFDLKFWENDLKFATIKAFPSYRGDWDEQ